MAEMLARRATGNGTLSQNGAMTNALFQPYLHTGDSVARIKVGDEDSLELFIDEVDMVKHGFVLAGVPGVRFKLVGGLWTATGGNLNVGSVTDRGIEVVCKLMAITTSPVILDLTSGQSGIVPISATAVAPVGFDTGVSTLTGTTPTGIAMGVSGTDAGVSADGGAIPTAILVGDAPVGTDAGVGGSTGTAPYDVETVAAGTDAGDRADTGTTPTAVIAALTYYPRMTASLGAPNGCITVAPDPIAGAFRFQSNGAIVWAKLGSGAWILMSASIIVNNHVSKSLTAVGGETTISFGFGMADIPPSTVSMTWTLPASLSAGVKTARAYVEAYYDEGAESDFAELVTGPNTYIQVS